MENSSQRAAEGSAERPGSVEEMFKSSRSQRMRLGGTSATEQESSAAGRRSSGLSSQGSEHEPARARRAASEPLDGESTAPSSPIAPDTTSEPVSSSKGSTARIAVAAGALAAAAAGVIYFILR